MRKTTAARVFLGTPALLTAKQQQCLRRWLGWLAEEQLEVVRLQRGAYTRDPWHALAETMPRTDGAVLLGFRQLEVRAGTWRPETAEEKHVTGWQTTPWLQVEAGMAVSFGLPVLAVPDAEVTEGAFRPSTWEGCVHGAVLSSPGSAGSAAWLDLVRQHANARHSAR
jgi:hypothetical protein